MDVIQGSPLRRGGEKTKAEIVMSPGSFLNAVGYDSEKEEWDEGNMLFVGFVCLQELVKKGKKPRGLNFRQHSHRTSSDTVPLDCRDQKTIMATI